MYRFSKLICVQLSLGLICDRFNFAHIINYPSTDVLYIVIKFSKKCL